MTDILLSLSLFIASPVRVALIDTGYSKNSIFNANLCDSGHLDLTEDKDVPEAELKDYHGHGTQMAGLIHQYATDNVVGEITENPLSPEQNKKLKALVSGADSNYCIVVIKIGGGKSGTFPYKNVISALKYVKDSDFDIINLSFGGTDRLAEESVLIKQIIAKGVVVVAAAGNNNNNVSLRPFYPAMSDDDVIVVGGYGDESMTSPVFMEEKDKKLIYMSEEYYAYKYKKTLTSNFGAGVDVWMPGRNAFSITNTDSIGYGTGTSQAAASYTGYLVKKMIEKRKKYSNFIGKRF